MNYRTFSDISQVIAAQISKLPRDIDLVVGIPRSGMLPATLISLSLNCQLVDLDGYLAGRQFKNGISREKHVTAGHSPRLKVLIVDDSVNWGTQISTSRKRIEGSGLDDDVLYSAVYVTEESKSFVDIWFEICPRPRIFEWNFIHHPFHLGKACVDIDGVLCEDPPSGVDDDGPNYLKYIANAPPKYLPTVPVANLVTCRLEKYRTQTMEWLENNRIQFGKLWMMQYETAAQRRAEGMHGTYKAEICRSVGATLFVESSAWQAVQIAEKAARPVLCTDLNKIILPSQVASMKRTVLETPGFFRSLPHRIRDKLKALSNKG